MKIPNPKPFVVVRYMAVYRDGEHVGYIVGGRFEPKDGVNKAKLPTLKQYLREPVAGFLKGWKKKWRLAQLMSDLMDQDYALHQTSMFVSKLYKREHLELLNLLDVEDCMFGETEPQ